MVKVSLCLPENATQKRVGFLKGQITVPEDFNQMGQNEIIDTFEAYAEGTVLLTSDKTVSRYSPVIYVEN
jgi:hypothetical protein